MREIGVGAFAYFENVESVNVTGSNFFMSGAVLYGEGGSLLHTAFNNMFESDYFETDITVIEIYARAFENANNIRFLTIPYYTGSIGERAFKNMSSLEEIYFTTNIAPPDNAFDGVMKGVIVYAPQGDTLKAFCNKINLAYVEWNPKECFVYAPVQGTRKEMAIIGLSGHSNCPSSHTDIVIPMYIGDYKVIAIADEAFASDMETTLTPLRSVHIPTSVKTIGARAFEGCTELSHLRIPFSVISIGDEAFVGCTKIDEIVFERDIANIGVNLFGGTTAI